MALTAIEEKNLDTAIRECKNPNYCAGMPSRAQYDVNSISLYADKHFNINLAERGDALRYVQDIVL